MWLLLLFSKRVSPTSPSTKLPPSLRSRVGFQTNNIQYVAYNILYSSACVVGMCDRRSEFDFQCTGKEGWQKRKGKTAKTMTTRRKKCVRYAGGERGGKNNNGDYSIVYGCSIIVFTHSVYVSRRYCDTCDKPDCRNKCRLRRR